MQTQMQPSTAQTIVFATAVAQPVAAAPVGMPQAVAQAMPVGVPQAAVPRVPCS